jgi:hypothetical protein
MALHPAAKNAIMLLLHPKGGAESDKLNPEDASPTTPGSSDDSDEEAGSDEEAQLLGNEFHKALSSKDPMDLVEAFKALFNFCENSPHEEG